MSLFHDIIVLFSASAARFFLSGLKFTSGIFFVALLNEYQFNSGTTSWITTLQYVVNCLTCAVGGILMKYHSSRVITIIGAVIMFTGMLLSSFADEIWHVFLTFGILAGVGSGLVYIGSYEAMNLSFTKYRNAAFGFGGFVSGMGVVVYPPMLQGLIDEYNFKGMALVMSGLYLNIVAVAILFPTHRGTRSITVQGPEGSSDKALELVIEPEDKQEDIPGNESPGTDPPSEDKLEVVYEVRMDNAALAKRLEEQLGHSVHLEETSGNNDKGIDNPGFKESETDVVKITPEQEEDNHVSENGPNESTTDDDALKQDNHKEENGFFNNSITNHKLTEPEPKNAVSKQDENCHNNTAYEDTETPIKEKKTDLIFTDKSDVEKQDQISLSESDSNSSGCCRGLLKRLQPWNAPLINPGGYALFLLSGIISLFGGSIITGHLHKHTIESYDIAPFTASLTYTAFGVSAAIGKLVQGVIVDKTGANPMVLYAIFGGIGGLFTLVFIFDIPLGMLFGYVILFSTCYASRGGAILPAMLERLAGEDNFAIALGVFQLVTSLGYLLGAPVAGIIYDITKSYMWPFTMAAITLSASSVLMLLPCGCRQVKVKE